MWSGGSNGQSSRIPLLYCDGLQFVLRFLILMAYGYAEKGNRIEVG